MRTMIVLLLLSLPLIAQSQEIEEEVFLTLCTMVADEIGVDQFPCLEIPPPIIVMSAIMLDKQGATGGWVRGAYFIGEPYVFLDPSLPRGYMEQVLTHEAAHYYHANLYHGNPYSIGVCEYEEVSRRVTDAVWGTNTSLGWREHYGCGSKSLVP